MSTVAIGVLLLVVAVIFESNLPITGHDPVFAGMFGVFGLSAILGGGLFYVSIKIAQRR
ncbi:hypothetical protein ACNS7O_16335 (plasmid) [Haloferacaceae archaeon DSL9]